MADAFKTFSESIVAIQQDANLDDTQKARATLHKMAEFLFFKTPDVDGDHISAFHAWWDENAAEIVGATIDDAQCRKVAEVLERHFSQAQTNANYFAPPSGVTKQQIANCRFFSAAQDFGGRFRRSPFDLLTNDPDFFSPKKMSNPAQIDEFLRWIGAEAQYDKRRDYARNGAKWLIDNFGGEAFNLYEAHDKSVRKLSKAMNVQNLGMGFSAKKCHMFVRDLFDWDVWEPAEDIHELDVASDANTMRIALRTGILRLKIPTLLPSYLDIYSPQYELMDDMNVAAWRRVWEVWGEIPDNHRVPAPAFFDFLIYMLGRTTCKKTTPRCLATNNCSKFQREDCPSFGSDICENGHCPFNKICPAELKVLQPPKSISIYGRTGWEAGRTNEGGGLGITA